MHYRATISPPGRYGVIAWDGFLNSNEECREKVMMSDNKEKLYFLTNALKEPNLLKECFMHFYLAHSDVNGQFVLEHNLVVENAKDDNVWCLLWNSTNYISKRWWSGNVPDFEEPTRIVHLQIIPVDEKLKIVIPSLFNKNIAAQITRDYQAKDLCSTKIEDNNSSSGQQLASLNQTESKEIIEYHPSNKRAQIVNKILNQWTNSVELVAHENAFFLVAYLRWVVFEVESCVENDNNSNVRDNVVVLMSKYDKIGVLMLKYGDAQFSKKRNKIVFSLLDSCLFGKKVCLIDELIIYYVEHLAWTELCKLNVFKNVLFVR
uniref:Uncharacterized protein n=1 Tax=Globodera rostochiensis TaxID=31243 RepID=A0A914I066_GLORO